MAMTRSPSTSLPSGGSERRGTMAGPKRLPVPRRLVHGSGRSLPWPGARRSETLRSRAREGGHGVRAPRTSRWGQSQWQDLQYLAHRSGRPSNSQRARPGDLGGSVSLKCPSPVRNSPQSIMVRWQSVCHITNALPSVKWQLLPSTGGGHLFSLISAVG